MTLHHCFGRSVLAKVAATVVSSCCLLPLCAIAATFDVLAAFNDTGSQPTAGNPFTYGTETTSNGALTLFPHFGNTNCTVIVVCAPSGSVDNYYVTLLLARPSQKSSAVAP